MTMDPARVPAELWLDIFELLVSPADLHSIIQTSRKFHNLAVRALHRHVVWRTPEAVVHNLPLWDASPGMEPFVHTFDLGVSSLPGGISGRIIEANGEVDDHHAYPAIFNNASNIGRLDTTLSYYNLRSKMSFASNDLHEIMFQRIMSFSNLSTLKFHSVIFFDKHFELIHALPQLRSLHLEYCIFQNFSSSRVFNHTTLPITDLTMLNLRRRIIETLDQQHVMLEENIEHALTLALARNLRSLAIDSTADVVKYIYGAWDADVRGWVVPHNLEQLYIYRKETSLEEVQLMLPGESSFPDFTLYSVLGKMPMLTTLSTFHLAPAHNIIMPVLPLLRNYAGPVDSIERLPGRPIQALGLFKCGTGSRDGVGTLANVKLMFPELQMLSMEFKAWDDEIIHAIATLFPGLRRLKVTFEGLGPGENTLVQMGPEFLSRLSNLRRLQICSLSKGSAARPDYPTAMFDPTYSSVEEELRNLVIPWNRYAHDLREVQLLAGYVMRRQYGGGPWHAEKVQKLDCKEDFCY